jgi:hypothetical protein
MKKLLPIILVLVAFLSLGSDSSVIRQDLVGNRVLTASTSSSGVLVAIDESESLRSEVLPPTT